MSEARADLPPAANAMGLRSGLPAPSGDVVLPNANVSPAAPTLAPSIRDQVKARWIAAGATPQAAEGIAMAIDGESGFDPTRVGDGGTSFGLYQHHNDRAIRLLDFAKSQNKSPSDPLVQTDFAIKEATAGGDPMATQHRDLFMKASDPNAARAAFSGYFERPASLSAQMMTPNYGAIRERMAAFDRDVSQQAERDRAEYERIRSASDPGSKERDELLTEARQRAAHYREVYDDFAKHPPAEKPIDALQNFGSIGTMLALLIGGMGRHHMNGALAAAGAMMQAAQANNHELFERQYKIWDHQSNMALNLSRLEGDEVRNLLEDKRMSENERQARLHSFYEEHNMTWQANQLRAGMLERVLSAEEARQRAHESAANQKFQFQMMMADNDLRTHPEKDPAEVYARWGLASSRAGVTTGQLSKDAIDALVQQAMTVGAAGILPSLPRSGPARTQFENALAERLKQEPGGIEGGTAKMIMNQMRMAEAKAAATTAGRVTMNTELYSQEAAGAGQLVIDASEAFPRTEFTTFNAALAAYETKTGDERIIRFGTALNSLVNAYGKMTNPTGTGIHDADKESLRKIIDTSLSKGQIRAGVEQILAEGRNVSSAAQRAQEEVLRRTVPGAAAGPPDTIASPAPPTQPSYGSPDDVYKAFDAGKISKDQAKQILIDKFGAKTQ